MGGIKDILKLVFPARAGINRTLQQLLLLHPRVPRASGDKPGERVGEDIWLRVFPA